jgi:hypothetical protein
VSTLAGAFGRLLAVLDRMEIPYEVGGSVASSAHGIPRTTLDVDIVVDLKPEQIDGFVEEVRQEFYADAIRIRAAFAMGRAANLIHLGSTWKFDLFPLRQDEYSRTEFGRRGFRQIRPDGGEMIECVAASVEDTILRKLQWYRAGGSASERQWNDVRGMFRAVGAQVDIDYLRRWAEYLEVAELLETLLTERGS